MVDFLLELYWVANENIFTLDIGHKFKVNLHTIKFIYNSNYKTDFTLIHVFHFIWTRKKSLNDAEQYQQI